MAMKNDKVGTYCQARTVLKVMIKVDFTEMILYLLVASLAVRQGNVGRMVLHIFAFYLLR